MKSAERFYHCGETQEGVVAAQETRMSTGLNTLNVSGSREDRNRILHKVIDFLAPTPICLDGEVAELKIPNEFDFSEIARIVQAQVSSNLTLTSSAEIDDLTGVYRRNAGFEKSLKLLTESLKTLNLQYIYLFFDIDDFGMVNKVFGHSAGDTALKIFTLALKNAVEKLMGESSDFVIARLGGEEFGVAVVCNDRITFTEFVHKIYNQLNQEILNLSSQLEAIGVDKLTASAGASIHFSGNKTTSARELLVQLQESANFAAINSKRMGKNRISILS